MAMIDNASESWANHPVIDVELKKKTRQLHEASNWTMLVAFLFAFGQDILKGP